VDFTQCSQYSEKYCNSVHDELREIKQMLQDLNKGNAVPKPTLEAYESKHYSVPVVTFQGESSFNSYATQASLTAETSARDTGETDLQIHATLASLQSLLRTQGHPSSADNLSFPGSSIKHTEPKIELPPLPAILAVLERIAG
jgi:hypothetical protein